MSCSRLQQLVRKAGIESKWPSSYFVSSVQNPPVCAIQFSSDRNINSCGWSGGKEPTAGVTNAAPSRKLWFCSYKSDSTRICASPHNRMAKYYHIFAFLQEKKSWKDNTSANTIIQLHCPCYCKVTINSQCLSTPKIQN